MSAAPARPPAGAALGTLLAPLVTLARRELQTRYAGTRLGRIWALLQPLATMAIYLTVFVLVMGGGRDTVDARQYALFILAGLLPFQALADGLQRACGSLRQDKPLLEAATFPAEAIPLARVVGGALPELLGLLLLGLACAVWGPGLGVSVLALPLLWLGRVGLTAGLALWISVIAIFITDTGEILGFALTALLFLTPVFYGIDQVPAWLHPLLWINPLHHVVEAYRDVLLESRWPWGHGGALLLWVLLAVVSGRWAFGRCLDAVRDEL